MSNYAPDKKPKKSFDKPFNKSFDKPFKKSFDKPYKSFDKPYKSNDTYGSSRPLHKAICAKCGVNCEVPFKPRDTSDVLCNSCFKRGDAHDAPSFSRPENRERPFSRDTRDSRDSRERSPSGSSAPQDVELQAIKKRLASIETKLDKILEILDDLVFEDEEE